jgi:hypothetical protein
MSSKIWTNVLLKGLLLGVFSFATFVSFSSALAQSAPWIKTFGGRTDDGVRHMRRTSDGGFIMPGWKNTSKSKYDASLIKLDARGEVEWQKTYEMGGYAALISVQEIPGGGYIATGDNYPDPSNFDNRDLWIVKVDSGGVIEWQKNYGGSSDEGGRYILQTAEGGYLVAGYTYSSSPSGVWILKLDSSGNILWQKVFGGWGVEIRSVLQTPDSGFMFTAMNRSFGAGEYDAWVVKLDSDGNTEWQKAYGGTQNDYGQFIYPTSDGGYILGGATLSFGAGGADFWVLKLDEDGDIAWQKAYGGADDDWLRTIRPTLDGGYIVAGSTSSFGAGDYDGWVLKLDASGNIQWQKTFGGEKPDAFLFALDVSHAYFLAGETESFGSGGPDIWLAKIERDGSAGNCSACRDSLATVTVTTASQTDGTGVGQNTTVSPQITYASEKAVKVTTKFLCGIPDLTGSWISLAQTCNPTSRGQKCKISGTLSIENVGTQDAPSSSVRFYVSDDGDYDEGVDTFLKRVSTGKVKLGSSKRKKLSYSFTVGESATGRYIVAVIDTDDTVAEHLETNNEVPYGPVIE